MQTFGRNQINVSRFRFVSDGIFDRCQVSENPNPDTRNLTPVEDPAKGGENLSLMNKTG